MGKWEDLTNLDATALAELVRKKEVSPIELVEAAVERIEKLNPALNAVVTPMYEEGRETASGSIPEGPFAGVPFLLKDFLAEYAGVRFTEGTSFLQDYVPEEDSELVKRYTRAGLVTIGKTNAPELAIGATTEPRLFGPTHNPWDTDRTPGGSSGGAAAAVASPPGRTCVAGGRGSWSVPAGAGADCRSRLPQGGSDGSLDAVSGPQGASRTTNVSFVSMANTGCAVECACSAPVAIQVSVRRSGP